MLVFLSFVSGLGVAKADDPPPMFMFVQTADDFKVNSAASTLRLVNVNQQSLFFSDRPVRIAGHMKTIDYLQEWAKGENNFGENPPNATLSVYEPGNADNTLAVVELRTFRTITESRCVGVRRCDSGREDS